MSRDTELARLKPVLRADSLVAWSLQTWHPASQGHVWMGPVAGGITPFFPSSKHHLLPTPHLTASPPTTHLLSPSNLQWAQLEGLGLNDPPKNRPRSSPLRSPCKTSPFLFPLIQGSVSPDSFLGYGYLTCVVSQDPMLGIMVWCCLKVLITSGQRPSCSLCTKRTDSGAGPCCICACESM